MNKVLTWAINNKLNINEQKSELWLYHEEKEKKRRKFQFI